MWRDLPTAETVHWTMELMHPSVEELSWQQGRAVWHRILDLIPHKALFLSICRRRMRQEALSRSLTVRGRNLLHGPQKKAIIQL